MAAEERRTLVDSGERLVVLEREGLGVGEEGLDEGAAQVESN